MCAEASFVFSPMSWTVFTDSPYNLLTTRLEGTKEFSKPARGCNDLFLAGDVKGSFLFHRFRPLYPLSAHR